MRVLAINTALGQIHVALVEDGTVLAEQRDAAPRGREAAMPEIVAAIMARAGHLDLIASVVGPGSFTGIRSGLALGHGLSLARDVPLIAVTAGEAIAAAFPHLSSRVLWTAIVSRPGHVFLEFGGGVRSCPMTDLIHPDTKIAIAGPAAIDVAARLAARGSDVLLTDARRPSAKHIADVATRRAAGHLPPLDAWPLYVDPPAARTAEEIATGQGPGAE